MKVLINQREIYNSNQLYSYKAYLDTELSYPDAVKDTYLGASGYMREENPKSFSDKGYIARKNQFAMSSTCQYIHKLDCKLLKFETKEKINLRRHFQSGFIPDLWH